MPIVNNGGMGPTPTGFSVEDNTVNARLFIADVHKENHKISILTVIIVVSGENVEKGVHFAVYKP
jgi:hypothetical protein